MYENRVPCDTLVLLAAGVFLSRVLLVWFPQKPFAIECNFIINRLYTCFVLQFWVRLTNANHFWVLQLKFLYGFPFYLCCLKKQSLVFPEALPILTDDELTLLSQYFRSPGSLLEAGCVTSPAQNSMDCQCKVASQTTHNFTYCFIFLPALPLWFCHLNMYMCVYIGKKIPFKMHQGVKLACKIVFGFNFLWLIPMIYF